MIGSDVRWLLHMHVSMFGIVSSTLILCYDSPVHPQPTAADLHHEFLGVDRCSKNNRTMATVAIVDVVLTVTCCFC